MSHPLLALSLLNLVLGIGVGVVLHRSDFCLAGMFRDLFLFRRTFMLRSLLLAVVVSMVLFELARRAGWLVSHPFPLLGAASLTAIAGGFLFGVGMVLAGGCVVGTLYKLGAGSLLSGVALLGLFVGSGLYAEIHPWWAGLAGKTVLFGGKLTLPELLGLDPALLVALLTMSAVALFVVWRRRGMWVRETYAEGYLQPWMAGLLLAVLGLASAVLVGMPLGITTAYAKVAAYAESVIDPAHVASVGFFQAVPLAYADPLTGSEIVGGAGPQLDAIAAIQFPIILGIILGSAGSAWSLGELRVHARLPGRQYAFAFVGGIVMALGSRMTPGCNVWHLLGGLPILMLSSMLFVLGLLPGAWIGSVILERQVVRVTCKPIAQEAIES